MPTIRLAVQRFSNQEHEAIKGKAAVLPWPANPDIELRLIRDKIGVLWVQSRQKTGHRKFKYGAPFALFAALPILERGDPVLMEHLPFANFVRMAQEHAPKLFDTEHTVHLEPLMTYPAFGFGQYHVAIYTLDDDDTPAVHVMHVPDHELPYFSGRHVPPFFDATQVVIAADYINESGPGPLPELEAIVKR